MNVQLLTILFVGISFAIYGWIAYRSKASSTSEFYVAGSGVGPISNGMATAADMMSAAGFVSLPGIIAFIGADGAAYLLGPPGGFLLLGIFVAPFLRRFGKFTIPDFFGDRYYSNAARTVALVCAVCVSFTYLSGQMRGVGVVFSRFLEVSIESGVLIGSAIVFAYAVWGGMKGITYTQVAQYCILGIAFITPIVFLSIMMTNNPIPMLGLGDTMSDGVYLLDKLDGLKEEFGFSAFTEMHRSTLDTVFITCTLMLGTAGMPHIIVRFFTVPKVSDARRSVAWTLFFTAVILLVTPTVSAFAMTYFLESINGLSYSEVPGWFTTWEGTGLIQFNDLNGDGLIRFAGDTTNELILDRDIMFLASPEFSNLPKWVIALVAAGGLAAALSTAAGLILVISTAISHDLIKKQFAPKMNEKRELVFARLSASLAICVGIYFGINPPSFVMETVALAFSIATASFFPALVLGIFTKRINKEGAIAGMVVGFLVSVCYILYYQFLGGKEHGYWMGISSQGIGVVGLIANLIVTLAITWFFPAPPEEVQKMVDRIRKPAR